MARVVETGITDESEIRQILEEEGCFNIFRWSDAASTSYSEHTHPHEEVRWVVSGVLEIREGKRRLRLHPGDRLESSANTPHSAYVPEDVVYICASRRPKES